LNLYYISQLGLTRHMKTQSKHVLSKFVFLISNGVHWAVLQTFPAILVERVERLGAL